MVRGRIPKPTQLKVLHGERNKDRLNENEPEAPSGRPPMPDGFDKVGQTAWRALCRSLEALGILSTVDSHALEIYCHCYSGYREALAKVGEFGQVLVQNGIPKRNPYVTEVHMHRAEIMKMQSEFGLTPSSRSRLHVAKAAKEFDILDELMN